MLWWWAIDYAQDGDISDYDPEDIAEAVDWPVEKAYVLMQSLVESRFVNKTDSHVVIHDWFDYAGRLVDNREKNKIRKQKSRENLKAKKESHANVTSDNSVTITDGTNGHGATVPDLTLPDLTIPNQTLPNHTSTTEQNAQAPAGGGIDPNYNPFRLFEAEGFGTLSMIIADKLNFFISDYGERWTCEAMKAAVIAGKRNLTYVKGILERYKSDGVDEPWNSTNKPKRTQSRSGKPEIVIVPAGQQGGKVTPEEFEELRKLAQKMDRGE